MRTDIIRYMSLSVLLTVAAACAKEAAQQDESIAGPQPVEEEIKPEEEGVPKDESTVEVEQPESPVIEIPRDMSDKSGYVTQTFYASSSSEEDAPVDEGVRTTIDLTSGRVRWEVGDEIKMVYYSDSDGKYVSQTTKVKTIENDGRNATFEVPIPSSDKPVYAVYPADLPVTYVSPTTGQLVITLSNSFATGGGGSFARANLAAARAYNNRFVFKSIGSIIAFKTDRTLAGGVKFRSIAWDSTVNKSEYKISGGIGVKFYDDGSLNTCEAIGNYTPDGGSKTNLSEDYNVLCREELTAGDDFYYLPVRPGTQITDGFVFQLFTGENVSVSATYTGTRALPRAGILKLGTIKGKTQSDFYFSTAGRNDSPMTSGDPGSLAQAKIILEKQTISNAMRLHCATLHFAAGTYTFSDVISPTFSTYLNNTYPNLTIQGESGTIFDAGGLGEEYMFDCTSRTGNLVFKDITFSGSSSYPIFHVDKSTVNLEFNGCTFTDNETTSNGACIFMDNTGSNTAPVVTLTNCTFKDNESAAGAAVYQTAGTLNISGGTFSGNSAPNGGALCLVGSSGNVVSATVSGATFSGNTSIPTAISQGGGAIYMDGSGTASVCSATFSGCNFTINTSHGYNAEATTDDEKKLGRGGVIFLKDYAQATFNSNCVFGGGSTLGNEARYGGIACINGAGTDLTVSGCNGSYNKAGVPDGKPEQSSTAGGCFFLENSTPSLSVTGGTWQYNSSQNSGGVFNAGSGSISVDGGTYQHNEVGMDLNGEPMTDFGNKGSIFNINNSGTTVTVTGSATFSNNTTAKNGGVINIGASGGTVEMTGATCSNNSVSQRGGVANFEGAGSLTLTNCTCNGNSANGTEAGYRGGGVVFVYRSGSTPATLTIEGGTYNSNSAMYGGVVLNSGATTSVTGGTFGASSAGNSASTAGGVVYISSGTVTLDGASAQYNSASTGGFANVYRGELIIKSDTGSTSTYQNNSATNKGGLVFAENEGSVTLHKTTYALNITANSATNQGGVVYLQGSATLAISGGTYKTNHAHAGGVVYHASSGSSSIINPAMGGTNSADGNYADGTGTSSSGNSGGGVFYIESGTVTASIASAGYRQNYATTDGGVAYLKDGTLYLTTTADGKFRQNNAAKGGVVYVNDGELHITGGTFGSYESGNNYGNSATTNGGVLYIAGGTTNIAGGTFAYNSVSSSAAVKGGFIYSTGGAINIGKNSSTRTSIANNTSGAIVNNGASTYKIDGAYFKNNTCTNGGAAIFDVNSGSASTYFINATSFYNNNRTDAQANGWSLFFYEPKSSVGMLNCTVYSTASNDINYANLIATQCHTLIISSTIVNSFNIETANNARGILAGVSASATDGLFLYNCISVHSSDNTQRSIYQYKESLTAGYSVYSAAGGSPSFSNCISGQTASGLSMTFNETNGWFNAPSGTYTGWSQANIGNQFKDNAIWKDGGFGDWAKSKYATSSWGYKQDGTSRSTWNPGSM